MGLDARVAVNLSARMLLKAGTTAMVASALRDHNADPTRLKREITKSAIMARFTARCRREPSACRRALRLRLVAGQRT